MQTLGLSSLLRSMTKPIRIDLDDSNALATTLRTYEENEAFEACLLQAQAWCAPRANQREPAKCLRSEDLKPVALLGKGPESRRVYANQDLGKVVAHLNKTRSKLLHRPSTGPRTVPGKILVFWPEETVHCGASEASSEGFFDLDDTPPWDTWFWYGPTAQVSPGIYAWVPEDLVQIAERGIDANPVQCMQWLGKS